MFPSFQGILIDSVMHIASLSPVYVTEG